MEEQEQQEQNKDKKKKTLLIRWETDSWLASHNVT